MRVFTGPDELTAAAGEQLGSSEWTTIDQQRIDRFADVTGDHQWIHVDPEKAAAGPFGKTIAHGFLTLSLLPDLVGRLYRVDGAKMGINYGMNRIRFPAPVPVDSKVRATAEVIEVTEATGGLQVILRCTLDIEGSEKPACVAEWVTWKYF
ncbi:MAG: MaoC family dehydratase [Actinomycetota bacterium]|nr:MaoC family dehydratase [Actinomycetota bacterium]